jgi:hypothetical protein
MTPIPSGEMLSDVAKKVATSTSAEKSDRKTRSSVVASYGGATRGKEIPLAQYTVSGPVQEAPEWTHLFNYRGYIPQGAGFPAKVVFTFSSGAQSARGQTVSFLHPTYTIDLREP